MPSPHSRPLLFRLGDLVVLVAILGVLAGLTWPALLRLGEAANRQACMSNLRQLAFAAHGYHQDWLRLPPGWLGPNPDGPDPGESPNVGVLPHLLPYFNSMPYRLQYQRDVKARTNPPTDPTLATPYDPPSNIPWWKLAHPKESRNNLELAQETLSTFQCPSARGMPSATGTIVGLHLYAPDGPDKFLHPTVFGYAEHPEARLLARSNYFGVAGCLGGDSSAAVPGDPEGATFGMFKGVFTNRSQLTLPQISACHGTANTLMFGESCGGMASTRGDETESYYFSWFVGALPTYYGLQRAPQAPWYSFNSKHRAKVHFAFCDASVRGIYRKATSVPYGDDWLVLQQLAGYRDGQYSGVE